VTGGIPGLTQPKIPPMPPEPGGSAVSVHDEFQKDHARLGAMHGYAGLPDPEMDRAEAATPRIGGQRPKLGVPQDDEGHESLHADDARLARIEAKLDRLERALKAGGLGNWGGRA
jgi:hypothetical protein